MSVDVAVNVEPFGVVDLPPAVGRSTEVLGNLDWSWASLAKWDDWNSISKHNGIVVDSLVGT